MVVNVILNGGFQMNAAHFHLILNHIPVILTILSIVMLIWAGFSKNREHFKIAFIGFIIAGVAIVFVFQSGENAEGILENVPGVSGSSIEAHEEAAEVTRWFSLVLAAGGIAGLVMQGKQGKYWRSFVWVFLFVSLITAGLLIYTASLGGQIRHIEILQQSESAKAVSAMYILPVSETDNIPVLICDTGNIRR